MDQYRDRRLEFTALSDETQTNEHHKNPVTALHDDMPPVMPCSSSLLETAKDNSISDTHLYVPYCKTTLDASYTHPPTSAPAFLLTMQEGLGGVRKGPPSAHIAVQQSSSGDLRHFLLWVLSRTTYVTYRASGHAFSYNINGARSRAENRTQKPHRRQNHPDGFFFTRTSLLSTAVLIPETCPSVTLRAVSVSDGNHVPASRDLSFTSPAGKTNRAQKPRENTSVKSPTELPGVITHTVTNGLVQFISDNYRTPTCPQILNSKQIPISKQILGCHREWECVICRDIHSAVAEARRSLPSSGKTSYFLCGPQRSNPPHYPAS
ncbi:hypothetical protein Bbelb_204530 [Branchiostoma belcheri]|nr:hypothetical protein Bbelb_204530 [Branchiostoma belcheri]